ncbi:unnamed protein product, partial [Effrenium voratum]
MDSSPLRKRGQEEQLQQLGNGLAAVQNGLASAQSGVTSAQNGVVSVQSRVQEEGREREGLRREFQQQQAEMRRQKEELQKHQKELQQHAKEIQKHAKELHLQTQLGLEDKRERHLPMQRLQAVSDDLHWFKRQVYDSGVLKPKIEVQEETPEPPVGSLDLNEHVYSAWLLIRLGFARVQKDQKMAVRDMIPLEEKPMSGFNSDEEPLSSRGSSFSDQEDDIVLGIQTPEILPGQKGYFQVTTGWLLVVTFTSLLQLLALSNMFAYGLTHGNVCLDKPMNNFDWWILHLSKAGGTIMVGAFMAGDVMDTVNFLMVEILVEKDASPKAIFFLIWRIVVIVFVGITNAIIFIVSTTPDGVWLMITAISFITDLPHGMMHVARSGMLGHYISKTITEMNFNLCDRLKLNGHTGCPFLISVFFGGC